MDGLKGNNMSKRVNLSGAFLVFWRLAPITPLMAASSLIVDSKITFKRLCTSFESHQKLQQCVGGGWCGRLPSSSRD